MSACVCFSFLAHVCDFVSRINFYCRVAATAVVRRGYVSAAVVIRRRGRGREDWPNGIGEPDRRRLADTRTMPSRALLGCAPAASFSRRRSRFPSPSVVVFSFNPHHNANSLRF